MRVVPVFTLVPQDWTRENMQHNLVQEISEAGYAMYNIDNGKQNPDLTISKLTNRFDVDLKRQTFDTASVRDILAFSSAAAACVSAYQFYLFSPARTMLKLKSCPAPAIFASAPTTLLTTTDGTTQRAGDGGYFDNTGLLGLLRCTNDDFLEVVYITREGPQLQNLHALELFNIQVEEEMDVEPRIRKRKISDPAIDGARRVVANVAASASALVGKSSQMSAAASRAAAASAGVTSAVLATGAALASAASNVGLSHAAKRKAVAYAKVMCTVNDENSYQINKGRRVRLHVISIATDKKRLPWIPLLRSTPIQEHQYQSFMIEILKYFIKNRIIEKIEGNNVYVSIGGGGCYTMCAGASILNILRYLGKNIPLGSGISEGSWAFAFASYFDVTTIGTFEETEFDRMQVALKIAKGLQTQLLNMYDGFRRNIADDGGLDDAEVDALLDENDHRYSWWAFIHISNYTKCNWSKYVHSIFPELSGTFICPVVVSWCMMERAWQASTVP